MSLMGRLTVLHAFPTWLPKTQTWMFNQIKYLPPDVRAHVVCEKVENLEEFSLPNIHCFADLPRWRRTIDVRILKLNIRRHLSFVLPVTKRVRPKIFHSNCGPIAWKNIEAVNGTGAKHVVTFYGYDVTFWPKKGPVNLARYGELFVSVAAIFCEGSVMARRLVELGCPPEKIIVHHLGVPLERIAYEPRTWGPGEKFKVLIAGRFREKKEMPFAIRALAKIRDQAAINHRIAEELPYRGLVLDLGCGRAPYRDFRKPDPANV